MEVLKPVTILDSQFVKIRFRCLEFSNGIGLDLIYLFAKGRQLRHQVGVHLLELLSPRGAPLKLAQLLILLFNIII